MARGIDLGVEPQETVFAIPVRDPITDLRSRISKWIDLGDTPEGEPAIHWKIPMPTWSSFDPDWAVGAPASQALTHFSNLAVARSNNEFIRFARRFGVLGLWQYRSATGDAIAGVPEWVPSVISGIKTPHRYNVFEDRRSEENLRKTMASAMNPLPSGEDGQPG